MNKRKLISLIGILLILLVIVGYKIFWKKPSDNKSDEVHYHAGFVVYKDGQRVDFSGAQYMTVKPCETEEKAPTPEEIQLDKAHLHGGVGDVLHVHTKGAKWKDVFTNLKYDIDYSSVNAYLNGSEVEELAQKPIEAYQTLVLFIGEEDLSKLTEVPSKERIVEVENTSVECGS